MVLTMRGCACPSAFTAMPPRKSRYFLPVESKTYAPSPCVNTIDARLYVGSRNCSASLSAGNGRVGFAALRLRTTRATDALIRVGLDLPIMPPKGPPGLRRQEVRAQRACRELQPPQQATSLPQLAP